jgi:hypothetical protein
MRTTNTECILQLYTTILCNYSTPPPTHQQASMYTYTIVGGGVGALPTSPHPLNACSHNTATRRPPHPSNTQQHTTKDNNTQQQYITALGYNSTQVHKSTNVPVVFMALILNGFEECNIITRRRTGQDRTITYRAIKTTGTFIVNIAFISCVVFDNKLN